MIWPAVRAVAAHEWSRRWRALLAVGLVAGLLGGLVVAAVGLTRRTATAPDRLFEAVAPGDVEVQVFGRPELIASISSRREVAAAWPAAMIVGQLEGPAVAYLGIVSGPPRPDGLLDPVVIDGREPDPAEPHEVALHEQAADDLGLGPGDHIGLHLLTAEEVGQFDVGFGVPDGPRVDLTVTGVIRVPNGVLGSAPLLGTPAFAARYGDNAAGTFVHAALRRGAADVDDYVAGVEDLAADVAPVEGAEEFGPVTALPLARGTVAARSSARVLVAGLTAAVVVSAVAGLFALGQAMARHQAVGAPDQVVEEALGMTRPERVAARLLPASVAALLAGAVAAGVALAGALVEPPGAVGVGAPTRLAARPLVDRTRRGRGGGCGGGAGRDHRRPGRVPVGRGRRHADGGWAAPPAVAHRVEPHRRHLRAVSGRAGPGGPGAVRPGRNGHRCGRVGSRPGVRRQPRPTGVHAPAVGVVR